MKKYFLIIAFISVTAKLFGQDKMVAQIEIEARPATSIFKYAITIHIFQKTITIYHERGDSLIRSKMKKIAYGNSFNLIGRRMNLSGKKNLSKADSLLLDSAETYSKKLDSAMKVVTHYRRDTVVLERKSTYGLLLDSVLTSTTEDLMRAKHDRSILDGIFLKITLKKDGNSRTIEAESPDATSQPLISKLFEQTLISIYSSRKDKR